MNSNPQELKKLLEIERERLCIIVKNMGFSSREALMQSIVVDRILNRIHLLP